MAAEIQEFKLDNGLKVVVQEDHRAPVVVSQVWYRAGSLDEVNGKTGVAHVLEHMMFKGTKEIKAGQFSRLIAAAGGKENAFTAQDQTTYFQQLEKSQLPLSMKLEADRMANLDLTDEEFAKEIATDIVRKETNENWSVMDRFATADSISRIYDEDIKKVTDDLEDEIKRNVKEIKNNIARGKAVL